MRKTNSANARKAKARNFGDEAKLVRTMECIVATAARESGSSDEELAALGWTACGGAACAHHVHPRQRGGVGEGRMGLFNACARHGDEAGEASPIKGPSSKRREFEAKYGVNVIEAADAIAVGHEPPLGIRGLAARWAWWRSIVNVDVEHLNPPGPDLEGYDLAALMAWTRRAVRANIDDQRADEPAWERAHPDNGDDRYEAAVHVAHELGLIDSRKFPSEIATALCEQAGWPS